MLLLKFSSSSSSCCRRLFGALQLLSLSTSATAATTANPSITPPKSHNFIVDYLISKLGFSSQKAIGASEHLSTLKSIEKPESFVGFMRSQGFSEAQIRKMASLNPRCLLFNIEKTLAPKFQSLKDAGFSESDLVHLVSSNDRILQLDINRTLLPRIELWQGLLGSRDHLIRLDKSSNFLMRNIDKIVMPNLSYLRNKCGVSDERISMAARHNPRFITQNPQALIAAAGRVEKEMGVARSSGMFLWALLVLHHVSKEKFDASLKLMKKFGWSEGDFLSAFRKAPFFTKISGEILAKKMEFLLKEAGYKPSDVAAHPVLLTLSLEKRLIPRHHVVRILKSRGLLTRKLRLGSFMSCSDKGFMDKFVIPHKHKVPELQEICMGGCGKEAAL